MFSKRQRSYVLHREPLEFIGACGSRALLFFLLTRADPVASHLSLACLAHEPGQPRPTADRGRGTLSPAGRFSLPAGRALSLTRKEEGDDRERAALTEAAPVTPSSHRTAPALHLPPVAALR